MDARGQADRYRTTRSHSSRATYALIAMLATSAITVSLMSVPASAASVPASAVSVPAAPVASVAAAAPGNPGVPSDPTPLFTEDFQNRTHGSNVSLTGYTGASGQTYTAAANWVSRAQCNGFIIDADSAALSGDCGNNAGWFGSLKQLVYGLGVVDGQADPKQNAGVAAFTAGNPGANAVQFETATPLTLPSAGRFVTFSVDAVATSCHVTHPKLRFYLMDGATERPVSSSAIDPCTDGGNVVVPASSGLGAITLKGGRFPANGSVLLTGNTFGIRMRNENGSGIGNDGAFDKIRVLDATPQLDKSFAPAVVPVGGASTLTFTVTNTSDLAAKNGWSFTDALPAGLVVADPADVGGTCAGRTVTADAGASSVQVSGNLAARETSCTVTIDVTAAAEGTYENCATNVTDMVGLNPPGCASVRFETADFGDAPASYGTLVADDGPRHLAPGPRLGATVDEEADAAAGPAADGDDTTGSDDEDGVAATSVTNGVAPSIDVDVSNTTGDPATLAGWVDLDKSGTFDADERVVAAVPAGTGGTVTLTWSRPVTTTQDTYARFRLFPGMVADPSPTGAAAAGEVEDYRLTTLNPALQVTKESDATASSKPGDKVHYTVTLTNTGTGGFTSGNPARVVDDLSEVLDDATYQGDAATSVDGAAVTDPTYAEPRIAWSGPLAAGKSLVLTYSVVLKGGGDGHVRNTAFVPPTGTPDPPTPDCAQTPGPCATSRFELPKLSISKTSNRTELPVVGQQITYTVTVRNTGLGDYTASHPATFADDLSDVLDDATLTQADVSTTRGTATFTSPDLTWTGTLPSGETATITYTLTYTGAGDQQLDNSACIPVTEAADPSDVCRTVSVPGSGLRHDKRVDPASGTPVEVGQVLTYTLTFENVGNTEATVDTVDDLSGVLDDAQLVGVPTADTGLSATLNGTQLEIDGTVPEGQTRTVTYQVTVRPFADQGDHVLTNALACEPGDPTPCAPATTSNRVRHLVLTKEQTSPNAPDTGDQVTYTLSVHNDGTGDWTDADPAEIVDDLSEVLDDATWDGTAAASDGTVGFTRPELTWSGALAHGTTVTITYSVTVTNQGDHELTNTASVPGCTLDECTPEPVVTPLPHVVPSKTAAPAAGDPVQPGDEVTYTLSWTNDGAAAGVMDSTDDLSGVLDDAEVVQEPTSSSPAVTATRTGDSLRVAGGIPAGDTVTVTYRVRVKPFGSQGDSRLSNVLTQDTPQVDCSPLPCTPVAPPTTEHSVGDLEDWKTVSPSSGTTVAAGDRLTYTLHFASTGTGPVVVDRVDDLSGVLDDATLVSGPRASVPDLTVSAPAGGRMPVTGTLAPGVTGTVTYTVEVKKDGRRGDGRLGNFLLDPGQSPPASCNVASSRRDAERVECTSNSVRATDFNLTLHKRVVSGAKVLVGDRVRYKLQVSNKGPGDAPRPIVLRDPLPDGLQLVSAKGRGWTCKVDKAKDKAVCKRTKPLKAGRKAFPVILVARATWAAKGKAVNKATVSAAGDTRPSDNRDVAAVTVTAPPPLPGTGFRPHMVHLRGSQTWLP